MSPLVAAAALPEPVWPDADWDSLHAAALLALQEKQAPALEPWTDHNIHDPGITLLEAALWALADLHYRTANRAWDSWSVEVDAWRGLALATGADRIAGQKALTPPVDADATRAIAGAPSRARAVSDLTGWTASSLPPAGLSATAAAEVVRLLREPALLRAAFEGAAAVGRAVAGAASDAAALAAAAAALDGFAVWPEEVAALVRREQRHRYARRLQDQQGLVLQTLASIPSTTGPGLVNALETLLDVEADDARIALALDPAPRADPELWETAAGETTLWPPHPLQALTCEPVTGTDYRRLLLADHRRLLLEDPAVERAWVVPGLAAGVLWNGQTSTTAYPWRQGAFTFLLEPTSEPADETQFLKDQLIRVLTADNPSELDKPYFDLRTAPDRETPRRLLGDELCAAIVGRCPVVVAGTLELTPTANTVQVLKEARDRLDAFLSADRIAPFEPPDVPGPDLVAPRDLDGPWPRADDAAAYAADPSREDRDTGWQPGSPVRLSELVQLLQTVPGVLGVDGLCAQLDGDTAWQADTLELDPFCVPRFARDCLCTRIADPRECDA